MPDKPRDSDRGRQVIPVGKEVGYHGRVRWGLRRIRREYLCSVVDGQFARRFGANCRSAASTDPKPRPEVFFSFDKPTFAGVFGSKTIEILLLEVGPTSARATLKEGTPTCLVLMMHQSGKGGR